MTKGFFILEFKLLAAGLATIGLAGVGVGIGLIFSSLVDAYARNPHEMDKIFNYAILGFALCESIALFVLMIVFLILFAF